jgi:hypothetical protein
VLRWAAANSVLDSDLNQDNWGGRLFHFYAGDLYSVFSGLDKYPSNERITGKCRGAPAGPRVFRDTEKTFKATLRFDCELNVRTDRIANFSASLNLTVEAIPQQDTLDFKIINQQHTVAFSAQSPFKVANAELAELIVSDSLERLYEGKAFGSGWPQSPPRRYSQFIVEDTFALVFDLLSTAQLRAEEQ